MYYRAPHPLGGGERYRITTFRSAGLQNEKDTQELGLRLDALDEEIGGHKENVEALEAQIATARERMTEVNQQREGLDRKVRERERAIEGGRQVILRLLGEASTLKNQL